MTRYASLAALLLALPACPLVDAEADVQSACVAYQGVQVDAMPQVAGTLEKSFTVSDLEGLKTLADNGFELAFESADVYPTSGITDLGFVQAADVSITSGAANSMLPPFDFTCENCGSAAAELDVAPVGSGADAKDYLESGSLIVTLDLTGMPPAVAWTMDIEVCVTGTASYELNE
ncbi:MAG TPA: hypothetical protein VGL61_30595 [Kofleriaceae bacterium]|jgi:hypothetical protein